MSEALDVAVLSGSPRDADFVQVCCDQLENLGLSFERRVLSAHRQAAALEEFLEEAQGRGARVFIALAGMAAHLPGVVASKTARPVIGVPLPGGVMDGMDALLSVAQMPKGVPVACVAVGKAGARNAAILAAQILGTGDVEIAARVTELKREMAEGASGSTR
jgi:5-(carboxyamino)imidazole ribonucleotide mutase